MDVSIFFPVFVVVIILICLGIFFHFVPFFLWLNAQVSGVRISLIQLFLMRLRNVPPTVIVESLIEAHKAGLKTITRDNLEAHYMTGGHVQRVVHALEICHMTGRTYTSFRRRATAPRPFRVLKVGLRRERVELYARINHRVDQMMAQGLLEEARRVYPYRALNSLNTVGYKELFRYFDGDWTLEEAVEKIKRNSRVYSRKQMTWFRRDASIHWFSPDDEVEIRNFITNQLTAKG